MCKDIKKSKAESKSGASFTLSSSFLILIYFHSMNFGNKRIISHIGPKIALNVLK
jgi:hypothetical protein